jgi:hypothetical protein
MFLPLFDEHVKKKTFSFDTECENPVSGWILVGQKRPVPTNCQTGYKAPLTVLFWQNRSKVRTLRA